MTINLDLRYILVIIWCLAGLYALVGGSVLLVRRVRLMRHLLKLSRRQVSRVVTVRITAGQEREVSASEVSQAKVRVLKAASILGIGFIALIQIAMPDYLPQTVRQWASTIFGMTLAFGLDYVIYNDLRTDDRLSKSLVAAVLKGEITDNGD